MKADKNQVSTLLKTVRGQVEGILQMIDDDRYCIDISTQIMASIAILKKANFEILNSHMHCCVESSAGEVLAEKLDEMSKILLKLIK